MSKKMRQEKEKYDKKEEGYEQKVVYFFRSYFINAFQLGGIGCSSQVTTPTPDQK